MNSSEEKSILLIGGTGFIGSWFAEHMSSKGWKIKLVTRTPKGHQNSFPCEEIKWDGKTLSPSSLRGVTAVVNLAGHPIADEHWSESVRNKIISSRVETTQALLEALEKTEHKPKVIIQASAVGYYGAQNSNVDCTESAQDGSDFLAETCKKWEKTAEKLSQHARLCIPRIGVVLGWEGGAFPKLWNIYTSSLGSRLGHGKQWMNWIHIKDLVRFFSEVITKEDYSGVYNLVAPENSTNSTFHKELSAITCSFESLIAPQLSLKIVLGQRSCLVLSAPKVIPQKALAQGFSFEYPNLRSAFNDLMLERFDHKAFYLKRKQWVPASIDKVWDFMSSAKNLETITPPNLTFKIDNMSTPEIEKDTLINYSLKLHGIPLKWRTRITDWNPQVSFIDLQEKGPYKLWHHHHVFTELGGGTLIEDRIDYKLPVHPFGLISLPFVIKDLNKIFDYRREATSLALRS